LFLKTRIVFGEVLEIIEGLRGKGLLCSRRHLNVALPNEIELRLPIEPEPTLDDIRRYWDEVGEERFDYVLAIGGGSVIDTAKVLAALMTNGGDPAEFLGEEKIMRDSKRLIAVPTTHGSGSEVTKYAVIKLEDAKRSIVSERICPETAILDAELTMGLPSDLTFYTSIDALCHNVEAYLTRFSDPVTDVICEAGITNFFRGIDGAMRDELPGRERMVLCSVLGGMAINAARAYLVHALSHVLGAKLGVPHGLANAVFLPGFLKFHAGHRKLKHLENVLGGDIVSRLEDVYERYGAKKLSDLVGKDEAGEIVRKAYENRRLMKAGEKEITVDNLMEIITLCQ